MVLKSLTKIYFIIIILCSLPTVSKSLDKFTLSPDSQISILTCDPGSQIYATFGHSAIRVIDKTYPIDWVFNYGTFDFRTPNFYLKFISGKLDYELSLVLYKDFLASYQKEHRSIYEQKLSLSQEEKQNLFDGLIENYAPEHRRYRYDFFTDNCATRIDSIIQGTLQTNWLTLLHNKEIHSYRTEINKHLTKKTWLLFGLNILLGTPTDNFPQGLFLPDILQDSYATIKHNEKPLTEPVTTLYLAKKRIEAELLSPQVFFYVLAFVLLLLSFFTRKRLRYFDFLFFLVIGTVGIILTYTNFFSSYYGTQYNWNLLWAIPLHFIVSFKILLKRHRFLKKYFTFTLFLTLLILVLSFFPSFVEEQLGIQSWGFPFEYLQPILLCIIIRAISQINNNKNWIK